MAERLQHTLYQVSTATALVEGIYQGAVQVGALREHGDRHKSIGTQPLAQKKGAPDPGIFVGGCSGQQQLRGESEIVWLKNHQAATVQN